jgi:hypothetical protein
MGLQMCVKSVGGAAGLASIEKIEHFGFVLPVPQLRVAYPIIAIILAA